MLEHASFMASSSTMFKNHHRDSIWIGIDEVRWHRQFCYNQQRLVHIGIAAYDAFNLVPWLVLRVI